MVCPYAATIGIDWADSKHDVFEPRRDHFEAFDTHEPETQQEMVGERQPRNRKMPTIGMPVGC
jgi:hypothetical protein